MTMAEKTYRGTIRRRKLLKYIGATAGSSGLLSRTVRGKSEEMVGVPGGFEPRPASEVVEDSSGGDGVRPKDVLSGRELARRRGRQGKPPDHAGKQGPSDHADEQGPPDHSEAESSSPPMLTNQDNESSSNKKSGEPGVPASNTYLSWVSDRFYNGTYWSMYADWTVPSKPEDSNGLQDPNMYYFPGLLNTLNPYDFVSRKNHTSTSSKLEPIRRL